MTDTSRNTPAPERVTFARLKSRAGWGLRGPAAALTPGATVAVTKRDGSTTTATVGVVVWTDGTSTLAAVAAEAPAAPAPVARAANRPVAPAPAAANRPEPVVVLDDAPAVACCPACGYPQG